MNLNLSSIHIQKSHNIMDSAVYYSDHNLDRIDGRIVEIDIYPITDHGRYLYIETIFNMERRYFQILFDTDSVINLQHIYEYRYDYRIPSVSQIATDEELTALQYMKGTIIGRNIYDFPSDNIREHSIILNVEINGISHYFKIDLSYTSSGINIIELTKIGYLDHI